MGPQDISGGNSPQAASQMQNQRLAGGGAPVTSPEQLPQGGRSAQGAQGANVTVAQLLALAVQKTLANGGAPEDASAWEGAIMTLQQATQGAQQQQPQMPQGQAPQGAPQPQFQQGATALSTPQMPPR